MAFTVTYGGEEEDLGIVDIGSLNIWFDYETRKMVLHKPDGTDETFFRIFVEGDEEADLKTLDEAKDYIERLKESYK